MKLTCLNDISDALLELNIEDKLAVQNLRNLYRVYFSALNNPPEGVVGVGAISYAEKALIDAQEPAKFILKRKADGGVYLENKEYAQ